MARLLLQSTSTHTSIPPLRANQLFSLSKGSEKEKRSVRMMSCLQAPGLQMRGFSGLRSLNAVDTMMRPELDFLSKVSISVNSLRGRGSRCVARAMFERFTEKAIKVIMLAQEEARRLGHNFVGTEQILLGLIGEGTGIAAKVLKSMGINLKDARVEVEKIIGRGSGFVAVEIPFTPRAKRVLELSLEEARQLGRIIFLPPLFCNAFRSCHLQLLGRFFYFIFYTTIAIIFSLLPFLFSHCFIVIFVCNCGNGCGFVPQP
jgi:ATP-dependent Clp protease ATP-binding subunit ClpC